MKLAWLELLENFSSKTILVSLNVQETVTKPMLAFIDYQFPASLSTSSAPNLSGAELVFGGKYFCIISPLHFILTIKKLPFS
jgi:hypothetical protein